MKRFFSAITVFVIMFLQVAFADFDYSSLKESLSGDARFYSISEQDTGSSFITSDFYFISQRSFDHKYQSEKYYSYFMNDWLIMDYATPEAVPVRRLWFYISSNKSLEVSSITFTFDNNVCTFSDFYSPLADIEHYDNGDSLQTVCLVMGNDSVKFHYAILEYMYSQDDTSYDTIMNLENIKMTLHGTEDIEVELPNTFIFDFVIADMVFSDEDYVDVVNMAVFPTTFNIKTEAETKGSGVMSLGKNGEFAIQTKGSYVYNTPSSDLSGYETTDKWLFDHDENVSCIVHSYTEEAIISYHATSANLGLSTWDLVKRCIELTFSESANFFNESITFKRDGSTLVFTAVDDFGNGKVYYAYTFVILENGIVCISSNSTNDESAISFVAEMTESIMVKKGNGFIK